VLGVFDEMKMLMPYLHKPRLFLRINSNITKSMRWLQLFFLLFFAIAPVTAQAEPEEEEVSQEISDEAAVPSASLPPPPIQPVATRSIAQEQWADATKGLDYSKDRPKQVEPPKIDPTFGNGPSINWGGIGKFWGNVLQVLLIIGAICGIGYGIYRMMQQPRNRLIARDGVEITEANLDQYLHETDLDRFLRDALSKGNYALAVRLYYLQIIKDLSEKQAIRWGREKTNRDYLREMRPHLLYDSFRVATRAFERVWYGNQRVTADEYALMEPDFKSLLDKIRR